MAEFIFAYHGGKRPETPEAVEEVMGRWRDWMASLGDALITPGAPVGLSKTVSANGVANDGGANPLSGYSVVRADTVDDAVAMAKGCPILDQGTVEVAEIIEM